MTSTGKSHKSKHQHANRMAGGNIAAFFKRKRDEHAEAVSVDISQELTIETGVETQTSWNNGNISALLSVTHDGDELLPNAKKHCPDQNSSAATTSTNKTGASPQ